MNAAILVAMLRDPVSGREYAIRQAAAVRHDATDVGRSQRLARDSITRDTDTVDDRGRVQPGRSRRAPLRRKEVRFRAIAVVLRLNPVETEAVIEREP